MRETWSKIFRSDGAARPLIPSITLPIVIPTVSREVPFSVALGCSRNIQTVECFSIYSLRQRYSVDDFCGHGWVDNFTKIEIIDIDFPPPTRGTLQRDRKGFSSNELCAWVEPTLAKPCCGNDVAMKMLNHTHCRQPAHRNHS